MKFSSLLWIALARCIIAEDNNGFLKLDYNIKRGNENRFNQRFSKRDTFELTIENVETYYVADLKVGSEKEPIQVLLDTGSSDLWIMSSKVDCFSPSSYKKREEKRNLGLGVGPLALPDTESKFDGIGSLDHELKANKVQHKAATTMDCLALGSFATGKSDSWKANDTDVSYFYISYADGTEAQGIWGTDKVYLQDSEVNGLSFAVANISSSDVGVLGIGLAGLEITNVYADYLEFDAYTYENLPLKMKSEGLIKKAAYSMYLNDKNAESGSVLFGAIDKKKFKGDLETFELSTSSSSSSSGERLQIDMDLVTVENSKGSVSSKLNSYSITTLLDTGSTLSYLPPSILENVAEAMNLTYSSYYEAYYVNCKAKGWSVNFQFGETEIKVPIEDLIWEVSSINYCFLGIFENDDSTATLGDNFIRHAYVVYDLEDETISLAEVNYSDESDIEEISGTFGSGVADSSDSASASASTSASTSASSTSASASATSLSFANSTMSSSRLSSRSSSQATATASASNTSLLDEDDDQSPGSSGDSDDSGSTESEDAGVRVSMLSSTGTVFIAIASVVLMLLQVV